MIVISFNYMKKTEDYFKEQHEKSKRFKKKN